jgi:hypothetical protein
MDDRFDGGNGFGNGRNNSNQGNLKRRENMILAMQKVRGQEKNIVLKSARMDDPTFFDETVHVAHITFQNPKGVAFDYQAELYLGKTIGDKKATSGVIPFSVSAGAIKAVDFSISMPRLTVTSDTFHVYVAVASGGVMIVTYVSTEDVIVNVGPAIDITKITWD